MLQAIQTKYLGPTATKGARIKAKTEAASLTVNWDHSLNVADNHKAAAEALKNKMQWIGDLVGGCLGDGMCAFVFTNYGNTCDAIDGGSDLDDFGF